MSKKPKIFDMIKKKIKKKIRKRKKKRKTRKMARILAKPWNFPPGQTPAHRLVKIIDLQNGTQWKDISKYFKDYRIEKTHFFGTQGLVQFFDPKEALQFITERQGFIPEIRATVTFSSLPSMVWPNANRRSSTRTSVICIQVIRLKGYLGIQDIYEECAHFGNVLKIICFEKQGKFALVQMETVDQAEMVLTNIIASNTRYSPTFELRVQYSRNTNISVQVNNSKSFDFTLPDAETQFERIKDGLNGEKPFFCPEKTHEEFPPAFDLFRPIQFDTTFGNSVTITGFHPKQITADFLKNLFYQYGVVVRVKILMKDENCTVFLQMKTGLFARIAASFLHGLVYKGNTIQVEVSLRPDVHAEPSNGGNPHQIFKEYRADADDPDIGTYSLMWNPSKYVSARPKSHDLSDLNIPNAQYLESSNSWQFNSIDEATDYIGEHSQTLHNKKTMTLLYVRPPSPQEN